MTRTPSARPHARIEGGAAAAREPGTGGGVRARPPDENDAPLGSWARLYALVVAVLALDVLLLAWLTERFR